MGSAPALGRNVQPNPRDRPPTKLPASGLLPDRLNRLGGRSPLAGDGERARPRLRFSAQPEEIALTLNRPQAGSYLIGLTRLKVGARLRAIRISAALGRNVQPEPRGSPSHEIARKQAPT